MSPAAVLAVIVKAQGITETNAKLASVQKTLEKTESATTKLGSSMVKSGRKMTSVGKTLTRDVTAPIIGIGVAAGVLSAKFHRSMNLIATDAGGSKKEIKGLSKGVLELAKHSEFGPQKLADALFYVESAGIRGKKALKTLNLAQKAAMAGNADLEEITFTLVGAMNAFGGGVDGVDKKLAIMNSTVGHGHLRMEELSQAMSTGVMGVAKTFGLSFEGLNSAIAFFTRESEPAVQAATRLRQTIVHLSTAATEKAEKAMNSIGLNFAEMGDSIERTHRLFPVLEMLKEHLAGLKPSEQKQLITEAFGGGRFGTQIMTAIKNLHLFKRTEEEVAKNSKVADLHRNELLQEESNAVKLKILWSSIEATLIKLGDAVLPVIIPIFEKLVSWLEKGAHWFEHLSHHSQTLVVIFALVAASIGPLLIILGTLIKSIGYIVKGIGKLIDWFTKSEVVVDEVVTSNEGLAASYATVAEAAEASAAAQTAAIEEVAAAQKVAEAERIAGLPIGGLSGQQSMSQIIPAAEEGAQMSLFAQPVTAAVKNIGPEIEAAAKPGILASARGLVGEFGGAIGFNMPTMIAGLGLMNILQSAMSGDMEGAGYEAGGALVGGIAGFFLGGPVGAMIGGGIGSMVSGVIGPVVGDAIAGLFGAGGPVESKLEHAMRRTATSFQNSIGRSHKAFGGMSESAKEVHKAAAKVKSATNQVKAAENRLDAARSHHAGARKQLQDEIKLREAKLKLAHANSRLTESEHLQGVRRQLAIRTTKGTVQAEKQRIQTVTKSLHSFEHEGQVALKNGAGLKRLGHIQEEITRTAKGKQRAEQALNKTLTEAANLIGPNYAQKLKKVKTVQEEVAGAERKATREFQATHHIIPNSLQEAITAWKRNKGAAENSGKVIHRVKEQYGPFKKEAHSALHTATKDTQSFAQAGQKGMGAYATQLNSFASQLGIANVHFTIGKAEKEGKQHKKKLGGMVVPGSGTGDKVPLTAMVEPGEIVHVLNKRASKKLGALEAINNQYPRFKEGGAMGGSTTAAAIAEANKINAAEYPYVWGGGHGSFSGPYDCSGAVSAVLHAANLLSKPMVSGELANYGAAGPGPITIYANGVHAFMSIMGKYFGTSGSNPGGGAGWFPASVGNAEASAGDSGGAFAVRHPTGAGVMQLAREMLLGPAGELQKTGQESLDLAQKMGNKWLTKNAPGSFGGGDANIFAGAKGPVSKTVASSAAKFGVPFWIEWGIAGAESTWGKGGSNLFGLLAAAEGADTSNWKSASEQSSRTMSRLHHELGSWEAAMRAYSGGEYGLAHVKELFNQQPANFAKGGTAQAGKDGKTEKKQDPLAKSIKNVLTGIRKGKHLPKYNGALNKVGRHIDAIGLNSKELGRLEGLQHLTDEVSKFQEYAENASTLTRSIENPATEEEEIIQGIFKGQNEGSWLNHVLETLLNLRRHVVTEINVDTPQLPHVKKLLKEAHSRLRAVQKSIREAEKRKRELEKKIKEIEQANKQSTNQLEKEIHEKEHELSHEENQKKPNKATLEKLRGEIHTRKDAISSSGKQSHDEIKGLKEHIRKIERGQRARHREENALTGTIIPKLDAKESSIAELLQGLRGDSSEVEGKGKHISFSGLSTIQGAGTGLEEIGNPPPLGSVGGEIFTVQNRLKEIQEEAERSKKGAAAPGESDSEKEIKELEKEIETIKYQREKVQQVQGQIIENFPTVQQLANPYLPFAGSFASGGVMMAEVGERGREVIAAPRGSRVVSSPEVQAAIRGRGATHLTIEEMNLHPDGTVEARTEDENLNVKVKKFNRKESLNSMKRTPGGKGMRR